MITYGEVRDIIPVIALTGWAVYFVYFLMKRRQRVISNQDFTFLCFIAVSGLSAIPFAEYRLPYWYHSVGVVAGLALMHCAQRFTFVSVWYKKPSKYLNNRDGK